MAPLSSTGKGVHIKGPFGDTRGALLFSIGEGLQLA
jgi:hypothetical protein